MTKINQITGIIVRIIAGVEDLYTGLKEDTFWIIDDEIDKDCEDIHVFFISGKEINVFPHEYEEVTATKYPHGFFQWSKFDGAPDLLKARVWPMERAPVAQFGYPDHYAIFRRGSSAFLELATNFRVVTITPEAAPVDAPKARTTDYPEGSQKALIIDHLAKGKTLTRITADHLYRVASLTKRISELKADGFPIKAIVKVDETGRPYKEYSLRNAKGLR